MPIKAQKGFYRVVNPRKVILPINDHILKNRILKDDNGNILFEYRSKWEAYYMQELDFSDEVERWGYECDTIKYLDPTSNFKERNYFIDFVVYWKTGIVEYIEVKPFYQSIEPIRPVSKSKKKTKKQMRYEDEIVTYNKNMAKWNACKQKCDNLTMTYPNAKFVFTIATEKDRLKHLIKGK